MEGWDGFANLLLHPLLVPPTWDCVINPVHDSVLAPSRANKYGSIQDKDAGNTKATHKIKNIKREGKNHIRRCIHFQLEHTVLHWQLANEASQGNTVHAPTRRPPPFSYSSPPMADKTTRGFQRWSLSSCCSCMCWPHRGHLDWSAWGTWTGVHGARPTRRPNHYTHTMTAAHMPASGCTVRHDPPTTPPIPRSQPSHTTHTHKQSPHRSTTNAASCCS